MTIPNRPELICGKTIKISTTQCGNFYVTLNFIDGKLFETFFKLGKTGGCALAHLEAISRLVSLALRAEVNIDDIIKQLKGIRCPVTSINNGEEYFSCADILGKVLDKYGREK